MESLIDHEACVDLVNLFAYGAADSTVQKSEMKDQSLATKLQIGDLGALKPPNHLETHIPPRRRIPTIWAEVKAS